MFNSLLDPADTTSAKVERGSHCLFPGGWAVRSVPCWDLLSHGVGDKGDGLLLPHAG